jgi:hypothetical protein
VRVKIGERKDYRASLNILIVNRVFFIVKGKPLRRDSLLFYHIS